MTALCPDLQGQGAYPGPLAELDFWSERAANLNAIHEQLGSERIQKVVKILELANSTYFHAFQRLYQVCSQCALTSAQRNGAATCQEGGRMLDLCVACVCLCT
jgi:hypothetical protein